MMEDKSGSVFSEILEIQILSICFFVIILMYFHFAARIALFKHNLNNLKSKHSDALPKQREMLQNIRNYRIQ